jgi:hypothetical protein
MVRSLRRISHDLVILARALATPLPEPVRDRLAAPARQVSAAIEQFLAALADALKQGTAPPALDPVKQAIGGYEGEIAEVRRAGLIVPLPADDAERIFGVAFALQQLLGNLEDLGKRTAESARVAATATAATPAGG